MVLLNFGHPLTSEQVRAAREMTGSDLAVIIDVAVWLDLDKPIQPQLEDLIEKIAGHVDLRNEPCLVSLPGLNIATAVVLAILHGRSGYFPLVLKLEPVKDAHPPRYALAEIVDLQAVRDAARSHRR